MPAPHQIIDFIDAHADDAIHKLAHAVSIPSVSADAAHRDQVFAMADFIVAELIALGLHVRRADLGTQLLDGVEIALPPAILAHGESDPLKKTILIYAHYDVQPALKSDGWASDPFVLTHDAAAGTMVGRGSTDDKGPLVAWFSVLAAHLAHGMALPVNLRFCFEGMEESGSAGLAAFIEQEMQAGEHGFFSGVDAMCITDSYWLNTRTPILTYGLRGMVAAKLTVSGPNRDLHSGIYGRTVHEPMTDLVQLLASLVASDGTILVPGIEDLVPSATDDERALYEKIDYDLADITAAAGAHVTLSDDKAAVLMGRMRLPALSLHGIEGAYAAPGMKAVIPASVAGKFSLRIVPPQTPADVFARVAAHLEEKFAALRSRNRMSVELVLSGMPWAADPHHWNYRAGARATEIIYGKTPDLAREGGTIPVVITFAESLGVNIMLLPMGRGDDHPHSTNEKLDKSNFVEGMKLFATYLYEAAAQEV